MFLYWFLHYSWHSVPRSCWLEFQLASIWTHHRWSIGFRPTFVTHGITDRPASDVVAELTSSLTENVLWDIGSTPPSLICSLSPKQLPNGNPGENNEKNFLPKTLAPIKTLIQIEYRERYSYTVTLLTDHNSIISYVPLWASNWRLHPNIPKPKQVK